MRWMLAAVLGVGTAVGQTVTVAPLPLLPTEAGALKAGSAQGRTYAVSLTGTDKNALEEDGPQRSAVADYVLAGRPVHAEAVEFSDRTGAYAAFTLLATPGMRFSKKLGDDTASGENVVMVARGATLLVINGATDADASGLKELVSRLPVAAGNKGVAPALPTFLPADGQVKGSVRYALGPVSYGLVHGVLPATKLGWERSAEVVTAGYRDRRGDETLTVMLYPTPAIAGMYERAVEGVVGGAETPNAAVRRQGQMVVVASGAWPKDAAAELAAGVQVKQIVTFDRDVQPVFQTEVGKTVSLLTAILEFIGLGTLAALVLAIAFGGGRAAIRVLQGKPASTDAEFLSLHLPPGNSGADLGHPSAGGSGPDSVS